MRTGVQLGPLGSESMSGISEGCGTSSGSITRIESSTLLVSGTSFPASSRSTVLDDSTVDGPVATYDVITAGGVDTSRMWSTCFRCIWPPPSGPDKTQDSGALV